MSIATKTGDDGTTCLWSGERVRKDDARIEFVGSFDESEAFMRDARWAATSEYARNCLDEMSDSIFKLYTAAMGCLDTAGSSETDKTDAAAIMELDAAIMELEARLHNLEEKIPIRGFVRLGSTPASAKLDICRTICRRAERRFVAAIFATGASTVSLEPGSAAATAIRYLNRLSDTLFMLARYEEAEAGALRYR